MHKRSSDAACWPIHPRMPPRFPADAVNEMKKAMLKHESVRHWIADDITTLEQSTGLSKDQIQDWCDKKRFEFKNKTEEDWSSFLRGNKKVVLPHILLCIP